LSQVAPFNVMAPRIPLNVQNGWKAVIGSDAEGSGSSRDAFPRLSDQRP